MSFLLISEMEIYKIVADEKHTCQVITETSNGGKDIPC